jgi:hypothetical protein
LQAVDLRLQVRPFHGVAALERAKPETDIAKRVRACELQEAYKIRDAAARKIVDENARKRISNGSNGAKRVEVVATSLGDNVMEGLAIGVAQAIADAVKPLQERIDALEQKRGLAGIAARIAELEQRPGLKYCGVFDPEQSYVSGDFCTFRGSIWHCSIPSTGERPGGAAGVWTLAVKHGRDGR